jgi:hypothetical protein
VVLDREGFGIDYYVYCTDVRTGRTRKGKKDMHRENNHDMDSRTSTHGTPSPWEVLVARAKKKSYRILLLVVQKGSFSSCKTGGVFLTPACMHTLKASRAIFHFIPLSPE